MPSNTRYTVVVEGQEATYWCSLGAAIAAAKTEVYAPASVLAQAVDDLKAGKPVEWGSGVLRNHKSVRIYPPQIEHAVTSNRPLAQGMTLRDYFAAQAMQAQVGNPLKLGDDEAHRLIAERAYRMADAMMKKREGK